MKKNILALLLALNFVSGVGIAVAQTAYAPSATPPASTSPTSTSIDQGDGFFGACSMYLAGYSNGTLVQALIDKQRPRYCLPPNLTRKDQLRVVLVYMKGHLDLMLEPTGAIIYKALLAAFPCK